MRFANILLDSSQCLSVRLPVHDSGCFYESI